LEREAEIMREMAREWLKIERALEAEMLKTAVSLSGDQLITEAMILRSTRFQDLMWQARAQYSKFSDTFDERMTELQVENLQHGIDSGSALLTASKVEFGLQFAFTKLNVNAIESMIGFAADGSPLRNLLMKSYGEAVNGILDALLTGLAKGLNPNDVAENMANGFSIGLDRALTIARTEQLRAYRMGSLEQYKQSGVVMQYKRLATKDALTCLGCLFQDGEIYSTEEEFAEHPNGRCVIIPVPVGADPQWETGKEWFQKLDESKQREILGDARFELWQNGTPLDAMSTLKENSTWGGAFVPTPLNQLPVING
jgi:SPP1 gp7 family putative phage head morphogenesis protein